MKKQNWEAHASITFALAEITRVIMVATTTTTIVIVVAFNLEHFLRFQVIP